MATTELKILLIIKTEESRDLLKKYLSDLSAKIFAASSLIEGKKLVKSIDFDLVICEKNLDKISGFQIFRLFRSYLNDNEAAFFLLLNEKSQTDIELGLEIGIDNFIIPPIQKESLINKISNHVNRNSKVEAHIVKLFRDYFKSSPSAMVIVQNDVIVDYNESFRFFQHEMGVYVKKQNLFDVFNFDKNPKNHLLYQKLCNGLISHCTVKNVVVSSKEDLRYNVAFYNFPKKLNGKLVVEIVPYYGYREKLKRDLFGENGRRRQNGFVVEPRVGNSGQLDSNFTKRENEILALSADGLLIKQIASKLKISERTVEKHRSNIMEKTGTHSMVEAILLYGSHAS